MNERIQELIRSADVHILPDDSEYGHCIVGLDRFAELLVKKCADVASINQFQSDEVGNYVRKHFGVKP
jgi:hypothetical protein